MTKARARNVLNVNEDERMTFGKVHKAFRTLSYPLELENSRAKNEDGISQVDLHEAFQHLVKYAKPSDKETNDDVIEEEQEQATTETENVPTT